VIREDRELLAGLVRLNGDSGIAWYARHDTSRHWCRDLRAASVVARAKLNGCWQCRSQPAHNAGRAGRRHDRDPQERGARNDRATLPMACLICSPSLSGATHGAGTVQAS